MCVLRLFVLGILYGKSATDIFSSVEVISMQVACGSQVPCNSLSLKHHLNSIKYSLATTYFEIFSPQVVPVSYCVPVRRD